MWPTSLNQIDFCENKIVAKCYNPKSTSVSYRHAYSSLPILTEHFMHIVAINRQKALHDYRSVAKSPHDVDADALHFAVEKSLQHQLKIAVLGVVAMFIICVAFLAFIIVTLNANFPT